MRSCSSSRLHVALSLLASVVCVMFLLRGLRPHTLAKPMSTDGPACGLRAAPDGLSSGCVGAPLVPGQKLPIPGEEALMSQKGHGTTAAPVQPNLRWSCDAQLADRICSYNRHYAEVGAAARAGRCGVECRATPPRLACTRAAQPVAAPHAGRGAGWCPLCRARARNGGARHLGGHFAPSPFPTPLPPSPPPLTPCAPALCSTPATGRRTRRS